ncbi:pinin/SDK/memA domain protein [Xylona heveae TC161]|uniref:Pinin/SDK/memA domain protein n=1 Tax=Xylona heveae (strain CBS 132557 / TC161) TaxID=1328760 RepID=A0A165FYF7_XYLHT|nr:pinin/SDK/memA domain protein [Xylona heveae TC161]KZF21532.1 pinin/SDK/memA domain protein [Xylona heveae TC161]
MSDSHGPIASAVVLPEAEEPPHSPPGAAKRRQSSISEGDSKRPRFEDDRRNSTQGDRTSPHHATDARREERRKGGQAEERKRGQRLFGALLGALNQNSPSKVQRRRADIEKKQQAKLRVQDEEYDELRKKRLEELTVVRQREQVKFAEQSMRIRHSNLLAMAHFLYTDTEPRLYYKPWELLPGDEDRIKKQVEEAEEVIQRELKEFEDRRQSNPDTDVNKINGNDEKKQDEDHKPPIEQGESSIPNTNQTEDARPQGDGAADTAHQIHHPPPTEPSHAPVSEHDAAKENGDDAGEVVLEAEEDTVIY